MLQSKACDWDCGLDWDLVIISERFGDYWSLYFDLGRGVRKVTLIPYIFYVLKLAS